MKISQTLIRGSLTAAAMAMLILDSKTVLGGAQKGVSLCIQTVIPSLFPFFVLSILLTGTVVGRSFKVASPLCRLFRIPKGTEGLLAAGFLGGYPVGAQCVSQAFEKGQLSSSDASRMLVICNNCGPAFLFGMTAAIFDAWYVPWILWVIQIASSFAAARLMQGQPMPVRQVSNNGLTLIQSLNRAIKVMASVCGWVVLFRIVLAFFEGWFLWLLPLEIQVAISGLLELSNGCFELIRLDKAGLRFILCAGMLNFGGICVTLQTFSVTSPIIDRSHYFSGKAFQCCFAMILAWCAQMRLFPAEQRWSPPAPIGILVLVIAVLLGIILRKSKNKSSIPQVLGV